MLSSEPTGVYMRVDAVVDTNDNMGAYYADNAFNPRISTTSTSSSKERIIQANSQELDLDRSASKIESLAFFGPMEAGFRKMQEEWVQQVRLLIYSSILYSDECIARLHFGFGIAIGGQERGERYAFKGSFSDGKRA